MIGWCSIYASWLVGVATRHVPSVTWLILIGWWWCGWGYDGFSDRVSGYTSAVRCLVCFEIGRPTGLYRRLWLVRPTWSTHITESDRNCEHILIATVNTYWSQLSTHIDRNCQHILIATVNTYWSQLLLLDFLLIASLPDSFASSCLVSLVTSPDSLVSADLVIWVISRDSFASCELVAVIISSSRHYHHIIIMSLSSYHHHVVVIISSSCRCSLNGLGIPGRPLSSASWLGLRVVSIYVMS